ncbi:ankyrin repeat domain-containing protein, partial [Candidatus Babeliales bacterium]|nr:ankyrin repeat domain-containing protein [Candidatus Babeliales bacterium]
LFSFLLCIYNSQNLYNVEPTNNTDSISMPSTKNFFDIFNESTQKYQSQSTHQSTHSAWKKSTQNNFPLPKEHNLPIPKKLPLDLYEAVAQNNYSAVYKILTSPKPSNINQKNSIGETALHIAVRHNYVEIIKLLLEYGANPNLQDFMPMWQFTPLHVAIMNEKKEAFIILLNSPIIDITIQDALGETPYDFANKKHLDEYAKLIKQKQHRINNQTSQIS